MIKSRSCNVRIGFFMEKQKYMISQINPRLLEYFIKSVRKDKIYSRAAIIEKLKQKDLLNARDPILLGELIDILVDFKLLELKEKDFILTELGQKLKSIFLRDPGLFYEIYHLLNYYNFDINNEKLEFLPFKSYQLLCNWISDHKQNPNTKQLADEIDNEIKQNYNVIGSFSEVCIRRGISWLKMLSPPVFDDYKEYVNRKPINIESVLLNLSYYYQVRTMRYGDPLFLNSLAIKEISRASLMDSTITEDLLKELADRFPNVLKFKYNISGSIVVLNKQIEISDII